MGPCSKCGEWGNNCRCCKAGPLLPLAELIAQRPDLFNMQKWGAPPVYCQLVGRAAPIHEAYQGRCPEWLADQEIELLERMFL